MTIDNELDVLDGLVRRLKVEYEKYFAEESACPPAHTQVEVESLLTKLSAGQTSRFKQRFRRSEITQRYAIYRDLWERKTKFREESKSKRKVDTTRGNPTSNRTTSDFDILGVSPTCSDADLRKAYRKKISEWHPDKLNDMALELRQIANDKCTGINLAYERIQRGRETAAR